MALVCSIAAMLLSPLHTMANMDGSWVNHSGASLYGAVREGTIHKIVDGNRYVYFSVRAASFSRSVGWGSYRNTYKCDPLQIFRYDKNQAWNSGNIEPLIRESDVKTAFPTIIEYSPQLGVTAVAYDNNAVELFFDDGHSLLVNAMKDITYPGVSSEAYSITFDPAARSFFVATSYGYLEIDALSGELLQAVKLDRKVAFAGRVGANIVVFAGNDFSETSYATTAYSFPDSTPPATLEGHEIKLSGGIERVVLGPGNTLPDLQALMPLTSTSFAAIAPNTSDNDFNIILVSLLGTGNRGELLAGGATLDNAASVNMRHYFRTEGFWQPTDEGFMVASQDNIWRIKSGVAIDYRSALPLQSFKNQAFAAGSKPGDTGHENAAKIGSVDGKRVWFHDYAPAGSEVPARGFYYRDCNDGHWNAKSATVAPNAPTTSLVPYMEWSPKYGMMFRGVSSYFAQINDGNDILCAYKDGKWTDLTAQVHYPAITNLTQGQRHIAVDPINPDWIWGSYPFYGLLKMDLGDYSKSYMVGQQASLDSHNNYFSILPEEYLSVVSDISFDKNSTMWFTYYNPSGFSSSIQRFEDSYVPVYYYTAADRNKFDKAGLTKSEVPRPHELRIPHSISFTKDHILALTAPGNENILVHLTSTYHNGYRLCSIYDHRGTLDNTADDRCVSLWDLVDQNGDRVNYQYDLNIYEDPQSGEVWVLTDAGPIIFNPRDLLDGNMKSRRLVVDSEAATGHDEGFSFEHTIIEKVAHDMYGRKWLATRNGVFCVSADTKRLLAHFTTANSPIPSDDVFTVGCDMSTGSVFFGTAKGLVEFHPEGMGSLQAETQLSVWPSQIGPDYRGHININGTIAGAQYVVENASGQTVRKLDPADGNRLQWDGLDSNGQPVAGGVYTIRRQNHSESQKVLINR